MSTLKELVDQIPPDMEPEARNILESLIKKKRQPKQQKLRLSWMGALKEYREQFTSLELQKKALEWWVE